MSRPPSSLVGVPSLEATNIRPLRTVSWAEFFLEVHPGGRVVIGDSGAEALPIQGRFNVKMPEISLHCASPRCGGARHFQASSGLTLMIRNPSNHFASYSCCNCGNSLKEFAFHCEIRDSVASFEVIKYGERPAFGPPTPAKLMALVGPEREIFLKGRRAELQGLGIGAFGYYRRVVESQKARILEEIVRVSKKVGASELLLSELDAAEKEPLFRVAAASVKQTLPQVLLINGHSPLTLLHSAISEGDHSRSDEDCLEIATSIRLVLGDFVEKVAAALKDDASLTRAVGRLIRTRVPTEFGKVASTTP